VYQLYMLFIYGLYYTCTNLDKSNVTRWKQINTYTIMKWVFMHRSHMHVFMAGQISYGI